MGYAVFLFFIRLTLVEIEWEMVGRLGIMGIRGIIGIDKGSCKLEGIVIYKWIGILSRSGKWGIANYEYIKCD